MGFVEVLKGGAHLGHHRSCIGQVHATDVVTLERIDEALGHSVALRTAHGCIDRLQAQLSGDLPGISGNVGAAVVREELQGMSLGNAFYMTEALRAGSGNLNSPISVETAPEGEDLACDDWSKDEQKTPPHALSGVQGKGGAGRRSRRQDARRAGAAA